MNERELYKRKRRKKKSKKLLFAAVFVICLVAAGGLGLWFGQETRSEPDVEMQEDIGTQQAAETQETKTALSNPKSAEDSAMEAGQKVTYDCVWFGSYPQMEVVSEEDTTQIETLDYMDLDCGTDYETVSAEDFQKIVDAGENCNENGDFTVDEVKYRRTTKEDASYIAEDSGDSEDSDDSDYYYNWTDGSSYHYFRYEPVKWRVLQVNDGKALLLSDVVLDAQPYNTIFTDVVWEESTIRSWLNNYDGDLNDSGEDYSSDGFLKTAFIASEREAIADTSVENTDNLSYGTEGGNDTTDQIFLLSESEVCSTDAAVSFGFAKLAESYDEARKAVLSTYAYAMGAFREEGTCAWWLRSPGYYSGSAATVCYDGCGDDIGDGVHGEDGVRPALYLKLSSTEAYSYAGSVCSDGTVDEIAP